MRIRTAAAALFVMAIALPSHAYKFTAWIPAWDQSALTSLQQYGGNLDETNPGWYSMTATGAIAKNWNAENPAWRAAMSGTDLIPTIKNYVGDSFNGAIVATLIATQSGREGHIRALTDLVVTNAFDGIDIDYEAVPTASRADFTAFINGLAQSLHFAGKKLSVTVHAKTSDAANWEGPGSQDLAAIGRVADSVKIMAYDKHWSGSVAGAITPLDWLDQVVTFSESVIPAAKIIVGLPWYGYDWQGRKGKGVVYRDAVALVASTGATILRDENGEATFSYADHTVYFQDAASYARKLDLLISKHPSIGGFAHWRTGGEDPRVWEKISDVRRSRVGNSGSSGNSGSGGNSGGSGATQPVADFMVSGRSSLEVRRGQTASTSFAVVPINGFSTQVTASAAKIDDFPGTVAFSSISVLPGTEAELRVTPDNSIPSGSYRIRLRFTSGYIVREQVVTVTVAPARTRAVGRG